jgi:hypothetical protein
VRIVGTGEHRAYLFEVLATDQHGNGGTNSAAAQWLWSYDRLFVRSDDEVALRALNAVTKTEADTCRASVSQPIIVIFVVVWLLAIGVSIGVVAALRWYSSPLIGLPEDADQADLTMNAALEAFGATSAPQTEAGFADAFGNEPGFAADATTDAAWAPAHDVVEEEPVGFGDMTDSDNSSDGEERIV